MSWQCMFALWLNTLFSVCAAVGTPESQAEDQIPRPAQGRECVAERATLQAGDREHSTEADDQEARVRSVVEGSRQQDGQI